MPTHQTWQYNQPDDGATIRYEVGNEIKDMKIMTI